MRAIRRFTVRTLLPAPLAELEELAHDLRWAWHPPTRAVLADLDPAAWSRVGGDPAALLDALEPERLAAAAADPALVARVRAAAADLRAYRTGPRWYQGQGGAALPAAVAWFPPGPDDAPAAAPDDPAPNAPAPGDPAPHSLEALASDHLRAASDLGVPLVAVGLVDDLLRGATDGTRDTGPGATRSAARDGGAAPLLREPDGTPVVVQVATPGGGALGARVRVARAGRVPVLLLDPTTPGTTAAGARAAAGSAAARRLERALLRGVGGLRAVRAHARLTGAPQPEVVHAGGAHAGFVGLERVRELVAGGATYDVALELVRATSVLAVQVPGPATLLDGALVAEHLAALDPAGDLPVTDVLTLGARAGDGVGTPVDTAVDTAVLALRLADRASGDSRRHGRACREAFADLWPGFDPQEVPIGSVTAGVHAPTWVAPEVTDLGARRMSARDLATGAGWDAGGPVEDAELWELRRRLRARLVDLLPGGAVGPRGSAPGADEVLTVGVVHRPSSGAPLDLLLADPERLVALLLDAARPVRLVVAAPPGGVPAGLAALADRPDLGDRLVVLTDASCDVVRALHAGCDVWLDTPVDPSGASTPSGMRAALNGVLTVAVRDGWWDEWYDGEDGWALPRPAPDEGDEATSQRAAALHELLAEQVLTCFHDRDGDGLPRRWLATVRRTLVSLAPKVQATRMVADHVAHLYAPAAAAGAALAADDLAGAVALAGWRSRVRAAWPGVAVDDVEVTGAGTPPRVGDVLRVRASVTLGGLLPDDVAVQVLHGPVDPDDEITDLHVAALTPVAPAPGAPDGGADAEPVGAGGAEPDGDGRAGDGRYAYVGEVGLTRTGPFGWTVRVVPRHDALTSVAATGLVATAG
ncbi:alpha-glucan family phosphorylase [Cellulomonas sp. zg-ZUI22]|uniref:alpha-glucan family phosphorylase n=1 Tax=Cellulomonas sp. zg-ZUI22 TaxID=2816955 RepID=UPI001A94248A|nr:alpha-glucan family phosphorylase [Cellulomonas sp. zg-ZUI22]MBO0901071.1 alpha-glucan family phosphorylase [Cellulomonas sp. zg-ZUI22]